MDYIKLIGGLFLLIISGDFLVRGGVSIATRLRISSLVIGMTVVAFGTSAPELLVSLQAALKGSPEIALGNVIGSNIANIGLILGLTALVFPIRVHYNSIRYDWPMMMLATLLFMWAASYGEISRLYGIIGVIGIIGYTIWQIHHSRKQQKKEDVQMTDNQKQNDSLWLSIFYVIASCVGLAYGADFLIQGASNIAQSMGVSERIIGVTIVAFGTSLPELAASLSAAIKKETDIAMGNIIGSNLFNILAVIGLTSAIRPIEVDWLVFRSDFLWMFLFALLLFILILPIRKAINYREQKNSYYLQPLFTDVKLGRIAGAILALLYVFYIYALLINK